MSKTHAQALATRENGHFCPTYGFEAGAPGIEVLEATFTVGEDVPVPDCPACGAAGRILAGIFDLAENTVKLLQNPERTVSELKRLREIFPCGSGERCESLRSQEHGPARVPGLGPGTCEAAGTQNAWRPLPASRPYRHDHRRIPGVRAVTASERRRTRPNHQQHHCPSGGSTRFGATSRILRTAPQSGPRREDWAQQAVPLRKWQEVQILPRQGRREAVLRTVRGIRFHDLEVGYDAERMVAEQWRRQALEAQERALAVLSEDVKVEAGGRGRARLGAHAGLLAAGGRRGAHDGISRLGPVTRVFLDSNSIKKDGAQFPAPVLVAPRGADVHLDDAEPARTKP